MSYMQNIPEWKRLSKRDPSFDPKEQILKVSNKLSEKQLIKLTKKEQIELIDHLRSIKNIFLINVPRYEKDRVKLILKLQN